MNLSYSVDSAGTANYHVGEPPDERAIITAGKFGVDISGKRGRQFSIKDFEHYDLIYAMDSSNYKDIIRQARTEEEKRKVRFYLEDGKDRFDVPDPWYGSLQDFVSVYELLEDASERIISEIQPGLKNKQ